MPRATTTKTTRANASHLGFEATLWATADKLRGNLDAAEYKHVVLGLIFLRYISAAFAERHAEHEKDKATIGADRVDRDEYIADTIFWVPPEAPWSYLQGSVKDPPSTSCCRVSCGCLVSTRLPAETERSILSTWQGPTC